MIVGIILTTLGLIGFICGVIFPFVFGDIRWFPLIYTLSLTDPGIAIIYGKSEPTKQDVLDGKAIYQETTHIRITDNDTTSWKTYEIVWINNNK